MNERERLIELILECDKSNEVLNCFNERPRKRQAAEIIADYLLANGVIVPPCKVGDTVWVISESRVKEAEIDEILRRRNDTKIFVAFECDEEDCDSCPFNAWRQSYCGEWDCDNAYGSAELAEEDFGKTVFLSRELAEKALAERSRR